MIQVDGLRELTLPYADQSLRYAAAYWPLTLRNLMQSHRVDHRRARGYIAGARISSRLRAGWHRLFDIDPSDQPVPILYNQGVGTLLYSRIFGDLRINFRHVRHIAHRTEHPLEPRHFAQSDAQVLACAPIACGRLDGGKALIELRTEIHAAEGERPLLAIVTDSFLILAVPPHVLSALPAACRRHLVRLLNPGRPGRNTEDGDAQPDQALFPTAPDMGQRYGRVSGDSNPVHTSRRLAPLFGIEEPFLQGMCVRNGAVRALARFGAPLNRITMSFVGPAPAGHTFRIQRREHRFSVLDERDQTVALGHLE